MTSDIIPMYRNHADSPQPEQTNIGGLLGSAGIKFLSDLAQAKKDGQEIPGIFNKVADILVKGESKAVEIAKQEAKKEAVNKSGWIIAVVLAFIVVIILLNQK